METEFETVTNLVTALEKAGLMAKHLSSTTGQDSANIYASLQAAHRQLSIFLAHNPQPHTSAEEEEEEEEEDVMLEEEEEEDSPMQLAADQEQDGDSKMITIEKVEQRMKDCFIHNKNKRLKRSLSSASLAAGEPTQRLEPQNEFGNGRLGIYDPHVEKLRALDLIYQFHS